MLLPKQKRALVFKSTAILTGSHRTLKELNIDDIPPLLKEEEKMASVGDLLRSRSGVYHEAAAESEDMVEARPLRPAFGYSGINLTSDHAAIYHS